jgi:hypothetical protein
MGGTGDHHVKLNKPVPQNKYLCFSHLWRLERNKTFKIIKVKGEYDGGGKEKRKGEEGGDKKE